MHSYSSHIFLGGVLDDAEEMTFDTTAHDEGGEMSIDEKRVSPGVGREEGREGGREGREGKVRKALLTLTLSAFFGFLEGGGVLGGGEHHPFYTDSARDLRPAL
jgi:hypothetical protein